MKLKLVIFLIGSISFFSCNKKESINSNISTVSDDAISLKSKITGVYRYGKHGTALFMYDGQNLTAYCNYFDKANNKKSAFKIQGDLVGDNLTGTIQEIFPKSNIEYKVKGLLGKNANTITVTNIDQNAKKYKNIKFLK